MAASPSGSSRMGSGSEKVQALPLARDTDSAAAPPTTTGGGEQRRCVELSRVAAKSMWSPTQFTLCSTALPHR